MEQEPVFSICTSHTRFRLDWRWDGREAVLQSRCTDETGYIQPTLAELVKVRGLNSIYYNNAIQSWKGATDGSQRTIVYLARMPTPTTNPASGQAHAARRITA